MYVNLNANQLVEQIFDIMCVGGGGGLVFVNFRQQ